MNFEDIKTNIQDDIKIKKEQEKKQENRVGVMFQKTFGNGEKSQTKFDVEIKYKMVDAKLSSAEKIAKNFFESNSYNKALVNPSYENNNKTDLKNLVEKGKINSNKFELPQNQR